MKKMDEWNLSVKPPESKDFAPTGEIQVWATGWSRTLNMTGNSWSMNESMRNAVTHWRKITPPKG